MNINKYIGEKIRYFRQQKNITQEELAEFLNTTPQTVSRYEIGERKTNQDVLFTLADYFGVSINEFFPPIGNAKFVDIESDTVQIPVLGVIKAGIPMEAQENILEYIEIPKKWTIGDKKFFGLKISGDSMFPKYQTDDIVVFEQTNDMELSNNKDCAVMVNGDDATFKKVMISEKGITLIPYNAEYEPLFFTPEEIENKPVRIIGIGREKRTRI